MKINIFFLFIISALFLFSCDNAVKKFENDSIANTVFDKTGIEDLQRIYDFFMNKTQENERFKGTNIDEAYLNYLSYIQTNAADAGFIQIPIDYNQQLKMYATLKATTFDGIWTLDDNKELQINVHSTYIDYLKKVSESSETIKKYHDELYTSGGHISANLQALFLKDNTFKSTTDINVKLIAIIHFLTLNDQFFRASLN